MSKCYECKKKIGIFESYRHPVIGGKKYVCGNCFTIIDESLEKWRKFIVKNSFNKYNTIKRFNILDSNFSNYNNLLNKFKKYSFILKTLRKY